MEFDGKAHCQGKKTSNLRNTQWLQFYNSVMHLFVLKNCLCRCSLVMGNPQSLFLNFRSFTNIF